MTRDFFIGREFDGYRITALIGRGGMATVYSAVDLASEERVALKLLYPEYSKNYEAVKRFQREVTIATRLQHPHIVPVYAHGEIDGYAGETQLYMVMRYISGGSLSDYVAVNKRVALPQVATWLYQIASALDYAHAQGVIHRDMKAANILIDEEGGLHLADFGIARMEGGTALTQFGGQPPGTAHYVSPEQATGSPSLDYRSDLYSLAVMTFVLCVGDYPYTGASGSQVALMHITAPIPRPSEHNPDLPEALDAVLMQGMAKLPSERYPSAEAFAEAFEQAVGGRIEAEVSAKPSVNTAESVPMTAEEHDRSTIKQLRPQEAIPRTPQKPKQPFMEWLRRLLSRR